MKNIKKLLALVLALAICAAFALPALASETQNGNTPVQPENKGGFSLKVGSPQPNHTYKLYQIYTGDLATDSDSKLVLSNVQYGSSWKESANKKGNVPTTELDTLSKKISNSADLNKYLAENIVDYIDTEKNIGEALKYAKAGEGAQPEGTVSEVKWNDLPAGYYLVMDVTDNADLNGEYDVRSAIMVEMVADVTVNTKKDMPTPDKKDGIENAKDENGNDIVADDPKSEDGYKIGDDVPFTVTATIPVSQMNQYAILKENKFYSLGFEDLMTKGLKFNEDSVKLYVKGNPNKEIKVKSDDFADGYTLNTNATVTDEEKARGFTSKFSVSVADLFKIIGDNEGAWKNYKDDSGANVVVVLTYTAKVTSDVEVLETDVNEAKLIFRNDPTSDSTGGGVTPPTDVPVPTFPLDVLKVDGTPDADGNKLPLEGAIFQVKNGNTVLKFVEVTTPAEGDTPASTVYKYYDPDDEEGMKEAFDTEDLSTLKIVTEVKTPKSGKILFTGLDADTYTLEEVTPPTGYNKCEAITVKIDSVPVTDETGKVTSYTWKYTINGKSAEEGEPAITQVEVENNKGSTLPSTGGMGTTILYIVGAVLVVGAGVVLFAKRRTSN